VHRTWPAEIVQQQGPLIVLDARFSDEIQHELLGTISCGTISQEYYWLDRWFNIFRFAQPSGELRNYYCNVNVPPLFEGHALTYIDLDIDILVQPDFSYRIVDLDEFEHNANLYHYPELIRQNAAQAMETLVQMIEMRTFPFSDTTKF
jgi:uncharacterized protein